MITDLSIQYWTRGNYSLTNGEHCSRPRRRHVNNYRARSIFCSIRWWCSRLLNNGECTAWHLQRYTKKSAFSPAERHLHSAFIASRTRGTEPSLLWHFNFDAVGPLSDWTKQIQNNICAKSSENFMQLATIYVHQHINSFLPISSIHHFKTARVFPLLLV